MREDLEDLYQDEGDTPLLTNVRSHADFAAGQGRDVYFAGNEGEAPTEADRKYKFSVYPERMRKPTDDELDFFTKRRDFMNRAKQELGYDPLDIDPVKEGYAAGDKYLAGANPVIRLFGPQTQEDHRQLKKVVDEGRRKAEERKSYGMKLLDGLDTMFRKDYAAEVKARRQAAELPGNETELINIAQNDPDPVRRAQAQSMLDAAQARKVELEKSKAATQLQNVDINALADSVMEGHDSPIAVKNTRGANIHAMVKTKVLEKYPKFDMTMADANYKWKQSATNQRTINFVGGALPRLGALDDQLKKLPNVDLNMINRVMRLASKEFGKPEYTNFESNRNAIVQEINTALSGTSQASDMRIKIELENLEAARSPQQIRGAIENLRLALEARLDVDLSPLYPIEVVRGEKTMAQYKKELFAKYRHDYAPHFGQEAVGVSANMPKVGEVRKGYRFKGGNPADKNSWEAVR
jgi:hypothetical protein